MSLFCSTRQHLCTSGGVRAVNTSNVRCEKQWYFVTCLIKSLYYAGVMFVIYSDDTEKHVDFSSCLELREQLFCSLISWYNGILVPVRTSFGLRRCGGKTYNVST